MIRRLIHRLAHWLDVNTVVPGSEFRGGRRVQGERCVGCGRFAERGN